MKASQSALFAIFIGLVYRGAEYHPTLQKLIKFARNNPKLSAFLLLLKYWLVHTILRHNGWLKKKDVRGKHVLITGGGMGIGRQMALMFSKKGCKVTIADLNLEAAKKVEDEIKQLGTKVFAIECDVSNPEAVAAASKKIREEMGDVDILINNAGIVSGKKLLDNNIKLIEKTIAVNATSHTYTIREFLPKMIEQKSGHIVTIASISGMFGVCGLVDYCASKFGAIGLDEALRMELNQSSKGVKTTCICPFYINTGMFDGVKNKNWLLDLFVPILQEKYAAWRIVTAILQEEEIVLMPWALYPFVFLKSFMPVCITDKLMDLTGMNQTMSGFKGRKQ